MVAVEAEIADPHFAWVVHLVFGERPDTKLELDDLSDSRSMGGVRRVDREWSESSRTISFRIAPEPDCSASYLWVRVENGLTGRPGAQDRLILNRRQRSCGRLFQWREETGQRQNHFGGVNSCAWPDVPVEANAVDVLGTLNEILQINTHDLERFDCLRPTLLEFDSVGSVGWIRCLLR